jgi:hypothetical protein
MALPCDDTPAFSVDVYYDILDDEYGLFACYRFKTKEIAEQFIEQVSFVCSEITYTEVVRTDDGHCDKYPFRPTFHNLEDAIADAKEFEKYGKKKEYKYHGRVFEVDLSEIEKQHDKNMIKKLKKENEELRMKFKELKAQHL